MYEDYKANRPEMPNELQIAATSFMGNIEANEFTNFKKKWCRS